MRIKRIINKEQYIKMDDRLVSFLLESKKKTVTLGEMEKLAGGNLSYEDFATRIAELVEQGVLNAIREHGSNHKPIPLANAYRIIKSRISEKIIEEIKNCAIIFHPQIKLDAYYYSARSDWENDLPHIKKIDSFLRKQGLPIHEATAPERSYTMVGDEKWIEEKGGRKLLERLGLWEKMKIGYLPDPLMLAVNPSFWNREPSLHLVVENKAPYYALLDTLKDSNFLSLIYGAGWKITADIIMLEKQLSLPAGEPRIYYFGDLDYEGISIWHALSIRRSVIPAIDFYQALLAKPSARGKENQQCNNEALGHFLRFFTLDKQEQIIKVLSQGGYYPQEGLNRSELEDIWRRGTWN